MRKVLLLLALAVSIITVTAQENPSRGDYFEGLTRPLTYDNMIAPYALEITFNKTVHIIFPSPIRYVDLGSADLLAAKAVGAENVLRVKAAVRNFANESNLAVITEGGAFYAFNVRYADEPEKLSIEMAAPANSSGNIQENRPNKTDVYMEELRGESPQAVMQIMEYIHKNNRRDIRHIGSDRFGVRYLLKGLYANNGLLYFHLVLENSSNIPFEVDFTGFRIVDKKVAKRTAIQEKVINPIRDYNNVSMVGGKSEKRMVFTLPGFTLPGDKHLLVEIHEKDGGRYQSFVVENTDLLRAKTIKNLKTK